METSESIDEIAKAMNKMQSEMEIAQKDIEAYKYKYADLQAVWTVLRDPLTKNGLMITQDAFTDERGASVQTQVTHTSGQWIRSRILTMPAGKNDAHSAGSALTYSKRYQLCALLGVFTGEHDDDGAAAMKGNNKTPILKPPLVPLTDSQIDAWFEKWSQKYDPQDIQAYCEARAKHLGHKVSSTCAELKADEVMFVKNIDIWLKQRDKD